VFHRCTLSTRAIIKNNKEKRMAEFTLQIDNMHCGACIRRVTQTLASTEGVEVKEVRLGMARLSTSQAPHAVDLALEALAKAGFPAHLEQ
jgi:copper chaperone